MVRQKLFCISGLGLLICCYAAVGMADDFSQPRFAETLSWDGHGTYGASDAQPEVLAESQSRVNRVRHYQGPGESDLIGTTTITFAFDGNAETEAGNIPNARASINLTGSGSALEGLNLLPHLGNTRAAAQGKVEYVVRVRATEDSYYESTTLIPLRFAAKGAASASYGANAVVFDLGGYARAAASLSITADGEVFYHPPEDRRFERPKSISTFKTYASASDDIDHTGKASDSFDFNGWLRFPVGEGFSGDLRVAVSASASGQAEAKAGRSDSTVNSAAVANAYVDPVFEIDPDWEYADRYYLEYSPLVTQGEVPPMPRQPSSATVPVLNLLLY